MNKEDIYNGLTNIRPEFLEEADAYKGAKRIQWKRWIAAAACFCLLLVGNVSFFQGQKSASPFSITAYAYGTDTEITDSAAVMDTGTISDDGEMKGHPLMFYLTGDGIDTVRFSCKNQTINFMDWTEKRDEFGNAQNFTVDYGKESSDYKYLTIDWIPDTTIRELTDHSETTIATLPAELREDVIVMEITFSNGETVIKAITVTLMDDGSFSAAFDDYNISKTDEFIRRPDSKAISRDALYSEDGADMPEALSDEEIDAAKGIAISYYADTVFKVNSMEYIEPGTNASAEGECNFMVNVSKDGIVQEADRIIMLNKVDGLWKVVNEGY